MVKRLCSLIVCITFLLSNSNLSFSATFSVAELPKPGSMVSLSVPYTPLSLKGMIVNPKEPLKFQFIVDTGNSKAGLKAIKDESNALIRYFLTGITIPEKDLWVNLSPYEKDRIVPDALGQTEMGRDLLAQDYILKQLSASLIYPEKDLGKAFWARVYKMAQEKFGTKDIPVSTFNKVWILPDVAQVYEHDNAVYVTKATLKVMLDEDYTALNKNNCRGDACRRPINGRTQEDHSIASQIIREIVLPEITKEVNSGKNFAPLRQIYQALILAKWYKETVQNSLFEAIYTDKRKIQGVNLSDLTLKAKIYERYTQAYKKGVFNYIKETNEERTPRKYFSGGTKLAMDISRDGAMAAIDNKRTLVVDAAVLSDGGNEKTDKAMNFLTKWMAGKSEVHADYNLDFENKYVALINIVMEFILRDRKKIDYFLGLLASAIKEEQELGLIGVYISTYLYDDNPVNPRQLLRNYLTQKNKQYKSQIAILYNMMEAADSYSEAFLSYYIISRILVNKDGVYSISITEKNLVPKSILDKIDLYEGTNELVFDTFKNIITPNGRDTGRILMGYSPKGLNSAMSSIEPGGVDLNQIKLNRVGKKVMVHFDQAQLSAIMDGNFQGFSSIITNLRYIQSPLSALGINP